MRDDSALFFAQVDLFFRQKAITDQTEKFCFVASILPQDTITEVRELIITRPTEKPYDVLRETVTASVTASTHKRISQLLEQETIGDSKPSQFLKRLQKLADKSIVKHIFLQRIPTQYKVAIAAQDESMPVEQLAVIADNIVDILSTQSPAISSAQISDRDDLLSKLMERQKRMKARMDKMAEDIARLTFKQKQGKRNWVTCSQFRERGQEKAICWKHKGFGENAN